MTPGLSICSLALVHALAEPDAMASLRPPLEQTRDLLDAMGAQWLVIFWTFARYQRQSAAVRSMPLHGIIWWPK